MPTAPTTVWSTAYQGQVLEPGSYEVPVDGRYWTGFDRTDLLDGPARDGAWSGTAHALVAELGVGAATHSTLQLALGVAALLAGLGVVSTVMGVGFIWHVRSSGKPADKTRGNVSKDDEPALANA